MNAFISVKSVSQQFNIPHDVVQDVFNEFAKEPGDLVLILEYSKRFAVFSRLKELGYNAEPKEKKKKNEGMGRSFSFSISIYEKQYEMLKEISGDRKYSEVIQGLIEKEYGVFKEESK